MPSSFFGFAATAISVTVFLPQAYRAWKTKKTKDLSMATYTLTATATSLWLIYGLLINDYPVIITNVVNTSISLYIIALKRKYG